MLKFTLEYLGPHYFQTLRCIWFVFGMLIDTGPNFYADTLIGVYWPHRENLKYKISQRNIFKIMSGGGEDTVA